MAKANPDSHVTVGKNRLRWKLMLLVIGGLILAAAAIRYKDQWLPQRQSASAPCISLPDNFDEIELPAQVGCWRLKLDPNKFSGKVWFPKGRRVNFRLTFENKNYPAQIQNYFGKLFTNDPKTNVDLGTSDSNLFFQYKGNGYVKIYILRIWSPMQQF